MQRALTLARMAHPLAVAPNPQVGAVLVHQGKIIGEGYHHARGRLHAERECFASVKPLHKPLVRHSTLYVTLEPCCHHGLTPPCVQAILEEGVPTVVVGCQDPNPLVKGKGIATLRAAGVKVVSGVLEEECYHIAHTFMVQHRYHRPYVLLKWAMSSDGFVDAYRSPEQPAVKLSNPFTQLLVHRLRSRYHGILVGGNTVRQDRPQLTNRLWSGGSPRPIALSHQPLQHLISTYDNPQRWLFPTTTHLPTLLQELLQQGYYRIMVEGGPQLLQQFIKAGLWDAARVEVAPFALGQGVPAPQLLQAQLKGTENYGTHHIYHYLNSLPAKVPAVKG